LQQVHKPNLIALSSVGLLILGYSTSTLRMVQKTS
jgi:hypothetical protein